MIYYNTKILEKEPPFDHQKLVKNGLQIAQERREMKKGEVGWISGASKGLKHKISEANPSLFCSTC